MYLLIRLQETFQRRLCSDLHSIMYLLIPYSLDNSNVLSILFTFHNVSINSSYIRYTDLHIAVFTFHNVSINSSHMMPQKTFYYNLHSIMYLLIHRNPLVCNT